MIAPITDTISPFRGGPVSTPATDENENLLIISANVQDLEIFMSKVHAPKGSTETLGTNAGNFIVTDEDEANLDGVLLLTKSDIYRLGQKDHSVAHREVLLSATRVSFTRQNTNYT